MPNKEHFDAVDTVSNFSPQDYYWDQNAVGIPAF
jgi:hypothetical protein